MERYTATGRLTADPEYKEIPNRNNEGSTSVCEIRIAVDRGGRGGKDGFRNVVEYGPSGKAAAERLKKGDYVAVDGRLESHEWPETIYDAKGNATDRKREAIVVVGHIEFGPKRGNGERQREQSVSQEQQAGAEAQTTGESPAGGPSDITVQQLPDGTLAKVEPAAEPGEGTDLVSSALGKLSPAELNALGKEILDGQSGAPAGAAHDAAAHAAQQRPAVTAAAGQALAALAR
jgi:single-stranded DNA-binding protein